MKYNTSHQKIWLVERYNVSIRVVLQCIDIQRINDSFCICLNTMLGFVISIHNTSVYINNRTRITFYCSITISLIPPLEGGYKLGSRRQRIDQFSARWRDSRFSRRCQRNCKCVSSTPRPPSLRRKFAGQSLYPLESIQWSRR